MDVPAISTSPSHGADASLARQQPLTAARFRGLYEAHFDFVWRAVVRLGVPLGEAEDAVQEVFLVAYRRWSTFAGRAALRTWLFAIARRVASHDRRRRFRHSRRTQAFGVVADTSHDGEALVEARSARTRLERFLDGLDPVKREVFILADLEGFTGQEVAHTLGIKPNTAWSRLKAARAEFSRTFGAEVRKQNVIAELTPAPPARASSRVWALMVPQLPWGVKAAAGGSAGVSVLKAWIFGANLKLFGMTVGVGLTSVAAVAIAVPELPAAPQAEAQPQVAKASAAPKGKEAVPARAVESVRAPPPIAMAAVVQPEPLELIPLQRPAAITTRPGDVSAVSKPRRKPMRDAAVDEEATPRPVIADPLAPDTSNMDFAELELVHRAQGALAEGQPRRALLLVEEHARRFPKSGLTTLRRVIRIEALCNADKRPQGIGEAAALVKTKRDPALLRRLQKACGLGQPPAPSPSPTVALASD